VQTKRFAKRKRHTNYWSPALVNLYPSPGLRSLTLDLPKDVHPKCEHQITSLNIYMLSSETMSA